jgi:hypothetical protein
MLLACGSLLSLMIRLPDSLAHSDGGMSSTDLFRDMQRCPQPLKHIHASEPPVLRSPSERQLRLYEYLWRLTYLRRHG